MAKKLKITKIKGSENKPKKQQDTLICLGLRKIHQSVIKEDNPQIRGMLNIVNHLVKVEEVK